MQSRFSKVYDALSQLLNVAFLRRHADTNPNESMSGRAHWEAHYGKHAGHWTWVQAERLINIVHFWDKKDGKLAHCELADYRDYLRAKEKVRLYEGRNK